MCIRDRLIPARFDGTEEGRERLGLNDSLLQSLGELDDSPGDESFLIEEEGVSSNETDHDKEQDVPVEGATAD